MNPLSVIIPSKTATNFIASAGSVRRFEPEAQVILVDDGVENLNPAGLIGFTSVPGVKPFVFARNVNLGIRAAGTSDVVLMNDDAILETQNGFSALRRLSDEHPKFGMIAPVTNVTGAPDQRPQNIGLREVTHIAFVCVFIPRRTLDTVGLMDERFTSYGWEDNDYCKRVRMAGLKIGVYDFSYVDHGSLVSTFRGGARSAGDIEPGRKIFREKWGTATA